MRGKIIIILLCGAAAFIGFMWKLPPAFRSIDKELHAVFYFAAAAFLNFLFKTRNILSHLLIFGALYLAGICIEYVQAYSNKFFRKRIHGRFDPEDVQYNLNGLIVFSVVWISGMAMIHVYRYAVGVGSRRKNDI